MNPRLKDLNDKRDAVKAELLVMLEAAGDTEFIGEDKKAFDEKVSRKDSLESQIKHWQQVIDADAKTATADNGVSPLAGRIEAKGPVILQDPKRGFSSIAEFGLGIYQAGLPHHTGSEATRKLSVFAAASGNSIGVGSEGGWLVPPEFSTTIWDGLKATPDSLLGRTKSYPIQGESMEFLANAETSRATGSRWGGIRAYWIAEADQMTSSKPALRKVKLEPQQLAVLCYATDKLLKSAATVEQWLTEAAVSEINFFVGDAIINGTGAGQPLGILNSGALVSVTKETGQASATITAKNVVKMWSRLHAASRAGAAWFVNQDVEEVLPTLTLPVGTGGVPVFIPPGGLSDSPYSTLYGKPVIPLEYSAALGTVGDIMLADMKAYLTGTRGGIESAVSMHLRFDYNETAFRFLFEIDGQPWLAAPITPFKGTGNTRSPFVALETRS